MEQGDHRWSGPQEDSSVSSLEAEGIAFAADSSALTVRALDSL